METKLCRICGKSGSNFVHIFKTEGLKNKIETCLPIVVSPHCLLPETICLECSENVDNFYSFIKNCMQNIIILEAQYDIQESCLKTKRKIDKAVFTNDLHVPNERTTKSVQTEDYLDVLLGKNTNLEVLNLNFPTTIKYLNDVERKNKYSSILVDYEFDSESNSDDDTKNNTGKVESGEKLTILNKINDVVGEILEKKATRNISKPNGDLLREITQRKTRKRKTDTIEISRAKIFKIDTKNKRKSKHPKKIESHLNHNDFHFEFFDDTPCMENHVLPEHVMNVLPQNCLLCDTNFANSQDLISHVFETHGIDASEIISGESIDATPEKEKKKKSLPNLVKISDLKRSDSIEGSFPTVDHQEDPPTLLPSFACPNCPAIFTTKTDLMLHLRLKHSPQSQYLCGLCLHQTNSQHNLENHLQTCAQNHPITTRYVCRICRYGDDNLRWLENHVLVHSFLIENCRKEQKIFDPADYIAPNEHTDVSSSKQGLLCTECGENDFGSFREFSAHRRSRHSIFHCDLCNKFYGRNSHLWKHVNRLHKGHPSVTCQLCYKTSASKYHLAQHFNKIHLAKVVKNENEKNNLMENYLQFDFIKTELTDVEENSNNRVSEQENDECNKMAPKEIDSSHDLYNNIITNYTPPLNEGDYKCPKCAKAFHKKVLLKKHKKNCRPKLQKDLLTRCKTCSRIFKDRQSLTKHLVNYHSEYVCEICGEKVQSKCEIVAHIRFQHPDCHLVCAACRNILRSRHDLQEHLRDHCNSYVCQFCADTLPSKIKLKMHILSLHRKILSLSCGICLKLFENQFVLRDHVTLVHKDRLDPITSCTVCGKNYGSKWKTYDHLNKSHGRHFKACKICLEVFDNDAQLESHGRTAHANGNPAHNVATNKVKATTNCPRNCFEETQERNFDSENSEENEENSEVSSEDDHEDEDRKLTTDFGYFDGVLQENKMSLLEKRLQGKKTVDEDVAGGRNGKQQVSSKNKTEIKKEKHYDTPTTNLVKRESENGDSTHSPLNHASNSSKRTVYVNSNDPSYCEICNKTWPAKKHLWQHYIRCHKTVAATVCGICLKTNPDYVALQTHLRQNHPTLLYRQGFGSNFICRICGRYHNASSKLKLHMVIHENFDWELLERLPSVEETPSKVETDSKIAQPEENDEKINYESLIEQVECSSDSENESDAKQVRESSSSDEEDSSEPSDASLQRKMLQNMISETQSKEYASTSEDSTSSMSETEERRGKMVETSGEDCSGDSTSSAPVASLFSRQPEELDSAIKSISYERAEPMESDAEDEYCDVQVNCLNENEIESAVGSIL